MELIKAYDADTDRIAEMLFEGRRFLATLGIDQWQGGYPQRAVIEEDIVRGESFLVIDSDKNCVATAMIGCRDEKDYLTIENGQWLTSSYQNGLAYLVVHRVAVATSCRGQGVGAFILDKAMEFAKVQGFSSVRIDTHPGNAPMQKLLMKMGFLNCGTITISHAENGIPQRLAYEKLVTPDSFVIPVNRLPRDKMVS